MHLFQQKPTANNVRELRRKRSEKIPAAERRTDQATVAYITSARSKSNMNSSVQRVQYTNAATFSYIHTAADTNKTLFCNKN